MTSFLDHLVGMALGDTPASAAHFSLPSRFAQPSATMTVTPDASQAPTEGPVQPLAEDKSHSNRRAGTTPAPVSFDNSKGIFWAPGVGDESRETRIGSSLIHASLGDLRDPLASPSSSSTKVVPQQPLRGPLADIEHPTVSSKVAMPQDFRALDGQPAPASAFPLSPRALPTARPERQTPPISDATMAGRNSAPNQDGAIVNITIDRLEVRAAAAPKPAPEQRRIEPQPALSLSDYLRGNGSGGRG